ncbi:hypothetical protein ACFQ1S_14565, partial [Kibdelosporangium lantanae]
LAVDHATQAVAVARQSGYRPPELAALRELATIHREAGQQTLAAAVVEEALKLCQDMGHAPCDDLLLV